jgi:IMP and pyridine-specific 5'-nucleotidase
LSETPGNWTEEEITALLDVAEATTTKAIEELNLRGRAIRKKRSVGLIPNPGQELSRESLDEAVLRVHEIVNKMNDGKGPGLPYCSFNGGNDVWLDVGNKRVGVQVLQSYLGIPAHDTLHIGDQFLNTGNDFAARTVAPCIWITNPQETTYILKSILRLAGVSVRLPKVKEQSTINFDEIERRTKAAQQMDVYTGEML